MKGKKLLVWVLVIAMAFTFAACGNEGSTDPETDPEMITETTMDQTSEKELDTWDIYYREGYSPSVIAGVMYRDEVAAKMAEASPLLVDFTAKDTITDIKMTNGEITALTFQLPDGRGIPCVTKGITQNSDGTLRISPTGYIASTKEVEGLFGILVGTNLDEQVEEASFLIDFGVNPRDDKEVSSDEDIYYALGNWLASHGEETWEIANESRFGFFRIYREDDSEDDLLITSIDFRADGHHFGIHEVTLDTDFYGWLVEGGYYDPGREVFNLSEGIFNFYLLLKPDVAGAKVNYSPAMVCGTEDYQIGELRDKDGKVKAKDSPLALGDTLDVDLKGKTYSVKLPIQPRMDVQTYYEASRTNLSPGTGDINVLVVPICFQDQIDAQAENMEKMLSLLGNTVKPDGSEENRESGDGYFTLSDYYEKASYGKLRLTSYLTDWYVMPEGTFAEYADYELSGRQNMELQTWINKNYADKTNLLDQNADGIYDAVIYMVAGSTEPRDYYTTISFGGAIRAGRAYGDFYHRNGEVAVNGYVLINLDMCCEDFQSPQSELKTNTLIHEFGHGLGLIDYYDVFYSGYNALGGYDMQSDNAGDWNPYSKMAVGWTKPTVLTDKEIGDGITITISDFESSGDTLVIPTSSAKVNEDGTFSPFQEYVMVDLFSPNGLHVYDASDYGLNKAGVRMYHVDASLIQISLKDSWEYDGLAYDVVNTNAYKEGGKYHIQLLQKGRKNTFTAGEYRPVCAEDFFYKGDSFSMKTHADMFVNGKMNDGTEFPYKITVLELTENSATIEIKPMN